MIKQVILVRRDLNMPIGKFAAQVAHACLLAADLACEEDIAEWYRTGHTKVVLEVADQQQLEEILDYARDHVIRLLPISRVVDEGRTVLTPGTLTCGAIGPGPAELITQLTGHLKLYK